MGKSKKESRTNAKAGLIAKNGDLSPQFKIVLREVFQRFDLDQDGALSMSELAAFSKVVNSGNLSNEDLKQLGKFFEVNSQGHITLKGFEQMYLMQTNSQASDTWSDLEKLGYKPNLEPLHSGGSNGSSAGCSTDTSFAGTKPSTPDKNAGGQPMDELRAALAQLKDSSNSAAAHRRVGEALKAMGREEAAQKSFSQAEELERTATQAAEESTINDLD